MLEELYQRGLHAMWNEKMYLPLGAILLAIAIGWLASQLVNKLLRSQMPATQDTRLLYLVDRFEGVAHPLMAALLMMIAARLPLEGLYKSPMIAVGLNLTLIWLTSATIWSLTVSRGWTTSIALTGSALLLLHFLGILTPLVQFLQGWSLTIGSHEWSLYYLLKGSFLLAFMLLLVRKVLFWGEISIQRLSTLSVNARELLFKLFQIVLYYLVLLLTLDFLGFSLTSLTVFSGATAVAVALAAQRIVANFLSGLMLLFEKSIKIGDLIEMESGLWAKVRHLGARAALLECSDGKRLIIPNEELANKTFANLTYNHPRLRLDFLVTVPYEVDLERIPPLLLHALKPLPLLSHQLLPRCYLQEFSARGAVFVVHFWVEDITRGRFEAKSEAMFATWSALRQAGIALPYQICSVPPTSPSAKVEEQGLMPFLEDEMVSPPTWKSSFS